MNEINPWRDRARRAGGGNSRTNGLEIIFDVRKVPRTRPAAVKRRISAWIALGARGGASERKPPPRWSAAGRCMQYMINVPVIFIVSYACLAGVLVRATKAGSLHRTNKKRRLERDGRRRRRRKVPLAMRNTRCAEGERGWRQEKKSHIQSRTKRMSFVGTTAVQLRR